MTVLKLCGCDLSPADVRLLVVLLDADVTAVSMEAAVAIRYADAAGMTVERLEPEMREAILQVLGKECATGSLACLYDKLDRGCC